MSLWFEITATVPPGLVEEVSALMMEASPGGVTIEEPVEILGPEQGFRVQTQQPVLIKAYVPSSELGAVLTDELRRKMQTYPVELMARPLYEEDWAVSWREFFGVVDTGRRIIVVPSWVRHEAEPGQLQVQVDPGQAFGTGHHETTRMCLVALQDHVRPGISGLDLGTGSGILSVAAMKLGAGHVTAFDIDPAAAEIARANLDANAIGPEVEVYAGTLDLEHEETYDLVVANIFANPLIALAPAFARVVRPGCPLLLSGILADDAWRVRAAFEAEGFQLTGMRYEGDWCLIELKGLRTQDSVGGDDLLRPAG